MSENDVKQKHELLKEFTAVLAKLNPMKLTDDDSYENEALSILSRFTEAALHIPSYDDEVVAVAVAIVKESLEFWFNNIEGVDFENIARTLLNVFRSNDGEKDTKQVISMEIG